MARGRGRGAGHYEYISLDGLRLDGRRPWEVRKIVCRLGDTGGGDGSAYYEQGHTRVLATVRGPREVGSRTKVMHDRLLINCEVSAPAFATASGRGYVKGDRRSTEVAAMIQGVFESVILTKMYPRSQVDIFIDVLQSDGGVSSAAINAVSLALINAGVPMSDFVCGCAVGVLDGEFTVDMNAVEAASGAPELSVAVLASNGKIASFELESRIQSVDMFDSALQHAADGCRQIFQVLQHEVKAYTLDLIDSRGLIAL